MNFRKIVESVYVISGNPVYANANVTAFVLPKAVVMVDCGIRLPAAFITTNISRWKGEI